jgi:hypothetical protein
VTARIDMVTLDDQPFSWHVPVVAGTSKGTVEAELRSRVASDDNINHTRTHIEYPLGPWNDPIDRDVPPIGSSPYAPPPEEPKKPAPQQAPAPKRSPADAGMGPLPDPRPKEKEGDPLADLARVVDAWRNKYNPTSAQYYWCLSRLLAQHAQSLLALERGDR